MRLSAKYILIAIVGCCASLFASHNSWSAPSAVDAHAILDSSIEAMGGRQVLASLKGLRLDIRETQFRIDDSERAGSAAWVSNLNLTETRDESGQRYRINAAVANPQFVYDQNTISDGRVIAVSRTRNGKTGWSTRPETHERLELSPERVLLIASAASDLRSLPDRVINEVRHHDLRFTWRGAAVDVFVNADTHLPDRIVSVRSSPYDIAQNAWGDMQLTTDFLFWKREPDGLVYPRQWNMLRNGAPVGIDSVIALTPNPEFDDGLFAIPEEQQRQFAADGHLTIDEDPFDGTKQTTAVANDVWLISGSWNVLVVRQPDGLVVIEAPESASYCAKVLDYLGQRFPGVKVKALVSSTDSTWHYAGLRTYVARGIPVYALDHNVTLLKQFLAAPHTLRPDEYARAKRPADLRPVADRTVIGTGESTIELYPIRGEADERMMMVYCPALQLLYGSSNDAVDTGDGSKRGTFNLSELVRVVQSRHLGVATYVGIHTAPTPWSQIIHAGLEIPALK